MSLYIIFERILVSFILGAILGFEREKNEKPAGLRTHIVVCVSSTLIMLTGIYSSELYPTVDPTRLAAQIISGIGFIGAGCLIKEGLNITGITTASSIWFMGAIGIAVGIGFYSGAVIATIFVLIGIEIHTRKTKKEESKRNN